MVGLVGGVAFEFQYDFADRLERFLLGADCEREMIVADRDGQPACEILDAAVDRTIECFR